MKRVCKCCGRNRRIGRFGRLSVNPNGKNIYCRECMRNFTNGYKCSPKGKVIQQKSMSKWRKKNKKAIKESDKRYYQKNKNRILYNKKVRECTLITEDSTKNNNLKINKVRAICSIEINPKRKGNG